MKFPSIDEITSDSNNIYINWNFFYLELPPTINFKKKTYQIPHNDTKFIFNALLYYPNISCLDKMSQSSLEKYIKDDEIHSDEFKNIYKSKKLNKNFFTDLKNYSNKKIKISKEEKENTIHFIVTLSREKNVYSIAVFYTNNEKIPKILSVTQFVSSRFMSSINLEKKFMNIFNKVDKGLSKDYKNKLKLPYLDLSHRKLYKACTKFVPCLEIIKKS